MSSDTILNNLFKIAQMETKEKINFNDFEDELRNNFNEMTNDEYDEALEAINIEVKNGNRLLSSSSGKIDISNAIIQKATSTVNYVKQLKELESNRNLSETKKSKIDDIVLTSTVITEMIKEYDKLTIDEKKGLIDSFSTLTYEQQRELIQANKELSKKLANSEFLPEDVRKQAEEINKAVSKIEKIKEFLKKGDISSVLKIISSDKKLQQIFNDLKRENPDKSEEELINLTIDPEFQDNATKNAKIEELCRKSQLRILLSRKNLTEKEIEEINELKSELGLEGRDNENILMEFENDEELKKRTINGKTLEKPKLTKNNNRQGGIEYIGGYGDFIFTEVKNSEHVEFNAVKDYTNMGEIDTSTDKASNLSNEKIFLVSQKNFDKKESSTEESKFTKKESSAKGSNFDEKEIKNAISIYQKYFQDFDEETLEEISGMTPEEIIANIKDDFDNMLSENQIDDRTREILDVLANNITENSKNILLDSEKREAFFEQMQNNINRESITDSEISELFERIGTELQVAPFKPVRESDVMPAQQFNMRNYSKSAIENTEVDGIFIENGVQLRVDEEATRAAMDAQAKGEDPEQAIMEYYEKRELENARNIQEQSEEREETVEDSKTDKPEGVVIKRDNKGKIQVLIPVQYLKKTNITLEQIQKEQMDLTKVVEAGKENEPNQKNVDKDVLTY